MDLARNELSRMTAYRIHTLGLPKMKTSDWNIIRTICVTDWDGQPRRAMDPCIDY